MRALLALASLLIGSSAFAVTIDFDDAVSINDFVIESGGFRFETTSDNAIILAQSLGGTYGAGLGFGFVNKDPITMSSIDGSNFALSSLDIGEIFVGDTVANLVTGYLEGGGTVELLIEDIDNHSVKNVLFDSAWDNLVAVEFLNPVIPGQNGVLVMDNIVVSAVVPVPAAVWLFGSGLTALGFIRRKA